MTPQPSESGISVPGTSTHFLEPVTRAVPGAVA
jgi:hypothetical protein